MDVMSQRFEFRYDRWIGWLMGLLAMGRRFSYIEVGGGEVVVRMGWAFRSRIPRSAVRSVVPDNGRVLGWGVHGWRGYWLVNGSSHGLVRLELEPKVRSRVCGVPVRLETLRVSLVEPDGLLAALR